MCKKCTKCGESKPVDQFNKSSDNRDGLTTWCKTCVATAGRKWYRKNLRKVLLRSAVQNAKSRGIPCTLTLEDIPPVPSKCPVLGVDLRVPDKGRDDWSPSLDRIDNAQGYVPGNVVIVSWRVNRLKGSASMDELKKIANFYERTPSNV